MHSPPSIVSRLKSLVPSSWKENLRRLRGRSIRLLGDYPDWESASRRATGYEAAVIRERVLAATRAVVAGEAAYERDSVLFHEPQPNHRLLAHLFRRAAINGGKLHVVDFGGSLGSTYWQHRALLEALPALRWSVVEQPGYVECGRRELEDDRLRFHESIEDCAREAPPDILLLCSTLQYLPAPWELLRKAATGRIPCILMDRTPLLEGGDERICIQKVPSCIYPASYPLRLLPRKRLLGSLEETYKILDSWSCPELLDGIPLHGLCAELR